MYVTKCLLEQMAEPRSTNFGVDMHIEKEIRTLIFIQIVNVLDLIFKVKDSNRVQ